LHIPVQSPTAGIHAGPLRAGARSPITDDQGPR
jgi:hypothetical protein